MTSAVSQSPDRSVWDEISRIAAEEGVLLFDMDLPGGGGDLPSGGVLRVYITRPKAANPAAMAAPAEPVEEGQAPQRGGVSFEDCTRVAKRILDVDETTGLIPDGCLLEVSSPGVNRRLRREEHFAGAVGERVRVKFRDSTGSFRVVTGCLMEANGSQVKLEVEGHGEELPIDVASIKEARVDFKF